VAPQECPSLLALFLALVTWIWGEGCKLSQGGEYVSLTRRFDVLRIRFVVCPTPRFDVLLIRFGQRLTCLHTSAYVSIRQLTSAYVSLRQHTSAYVSMRQHASAYVSTRQYTSAYSRPDTLCFCFPVSYSRHGTGMIGFTDILTLKRCSEQFR
jgi:hypothetical protein